MSFFGNNIQDLATVQIFLESHPNLKIVWFNENPLDQKHLAWLVENHFPNIQMLNSHFTKHARDFVFKYVSLDMDAQRCTDVPNAQIKFLNFAGRQILAQSEQHLLQMANYFPNVKKISLTDNECTDTTQYF